MHNSGPTIGLPSAPLNGSTTELETLFRDLANGSAPDALTAERRSAIRLALDEIGAPVRIVLPGHADVAIVNMSRTGLLLDTTERLCPGHAFALLVQMRDAREKARVRIVRSAVHRLYPSSMFRVALQFSRPLALWDSLDLRIR